MRAHRYLDLDQIIALLPRGPTPDYVRAQRLCTALGFTLAEGMALGEAFLEEPGVMEAVYRVAWAVLDTRPRYRLDRKGFLAALQLPAAVRGRSKVVYKSARRALARHHRMKPLLVWSVLWLLHLLLQASLQ